MSRERHQRPRPERVVDRAYRNHPVHDCLYAVLAKREQARLVTADRRFAAKLAAESIDFVAV
jgi:predicted nucleic acid-binding protein